MTIDSGLNEDDKLGELLAELVRGTDALIAAVLSLDGTCLCAAGDTAQVNITVLAFLVAEMISRCRDVAHVLGEGRFSTVMQHGENRHLHVTLLGDVHALVVAFADDRQTGLVRIQSRRTAGALAELLPIRTASEGSEQERTIPTHVRHGADLIDRIFAEPHCIEHDPDSH